jgi:hypothetical protein
MYGIPQDIINLTGVTPAALGLDHQANPEQALSDLLTTWLERISTQIDVRLIQGKVNSDFQYYNGIVDVAIRTVAKLVAVAQQQRLSPVVKIGEFATQILNTSQVIQDLSTELKPYQQRSVQMFSSIVPKTKAKPGEYPFINGYDTIRFD